MYNKARLSSTGQRERVHSYIFNAFLFVLRVFWYDLGVETEEDLGWVCAMLSAGKATVISSTAAAGSSSTQDGV